MHMTQRDAELREGAPGGAEAGQPNERATLAALFQSLLDAWGRGDAVAYGALFAEDADYVAFDGSHTRGRAAIIAAHAPLFERWLKGSRLVGRVEQVRFLQPDIAIVHATGGTILAGEARPRPSRDSIQSLVARKRDGAWHFVAFHNTRILRWGKLRWVIYGVADRIFRR
jgi:uncharacterized protein (TIGR02246 family)